MGGSGSSSVRGAKRGILKLLSNGTLVLTPALKHSSMNDPAVRDENAKVISQEPCDGSSNSRKISPLSAPVLSYAQSASRVWPLLV